MEEAEVPGPGVRWWFNLTDLDYNQSYSDYPDFLPTNQSRVFNYNPATIYVTCFLILCCLVSLVINVVILASVCFMRTRVNNTLYISLSLAVADTSSLFFLALGLFIFTLSPRLWFKVDAPCLYLLLEGLRMGAIMTNMFHLAALGFNHYLGILLPLRVVTRRSLQYLIVVLWTVPSSLLLTDLFVLEADDRAKCDPKFLVRSTFRMRFSIPFFTTLSLMVFIYVHIYHLVCLHQKQPLNWGHRHSNSQVTKKAIVTTILILGSTIFCWLPPFAFFALFCDDCLLSGAWADLKDDFAQLIAATTTLQFLLIIKPATNFYIYAFRMKEIRNALRRMRRRVFTLLRHPQSGARMEMREVSLMRVRSHTSTCRRDTQSMRVSPSHDQAANGVSPRTRQLRRGRSIALSRHNPTNTSV